MVILAAVGENHDTRGIIDTGYELAMAYEDELKVVHVIPEAEAEEHFKRLREIPEFRDSSLEDEADRAQDVARKFTQMALKSEALERTSALGRIGDPAEQILTAGRSLDARYIVIGGRKRSPTGKAVFGSATQSIVLNSDRPVVTVMARS